MYFMCDTEDFKELAKMIHHVSLPLRARYVYCCAPINRKQPFICAMFSKVFIHSVGQIIWHIFSPSYFNEFYGFEFHFQFANQHSRYQPITFEFVAKSCGLPVRLPQSIADLIHLENIFDVMDIYLWLSYRFIDIYPHGVEIRSAQIQLDDLIQKGVAEITKLIKDSDTPEQSNFLKHYHIISKQICFKKKKEKEIHS